MNSEMDSMYQNHVVTMVNPPEGINAIRCKWFFQKENKTWKVMLLPIRSIDATKIWKFDEIHSWIKINFYKIKHPI